MGGGWGRSARWGKRRRRTRPPARAPRVASWFQHSLTRPKQRRGRSDIAGALEPAQHIPHVELPVRVALHVQVAALVVGGRARTLEREGEDLLQGEDRLTHPERECTPRGARPRCDGRPEGEGPGGGGGTAQAPGAVERGAPGGGSGID